MNGARDIDVDELFDRNADTRLLERRRSEELGLPPVATPGSTTPARFGPESMVGGVPLAAPRGPMLRVGLEARPNRELIPGAVVTVVAEVGDDGDTDADDVLLRIAIPPESEPIAGSFARDGVELDGEALLGEGMRVGTVPAAGAIRVRFALRVLPGTEPLDIIASAHAPGVPVIAAPSLRLGRRSGHAAYAAPKPFFELEAGEVDEEIKPVAALEAEPEAEQIPERDPVAQLESVAQPEPAAQPEPVVEQAAVSDLASAKQPEAAPAPEPVRDVRRPVERTIDVVIDEPVNQVVFRTPGPILGPPPSRRPTFETITPPPFVLPPDAIRQPVPSSEPLPQAPIETPEPAELRPEPIAAIQPEPAIDVQPESVVDVQPEPVVDVRPEPETETHAAPEAQTEPNPDIEVQPQPEPALAEAPASLVLARVLDADEVRALERVFSGAVPHGLAALALLASVAAADAPLGRALGVSEFARSISAALPRALVAARMNRPPPPVVTLEALGAIRPTAEAPREHFAYEGALLVARLEPRELEALRTLLARQLDDPFLRGVQVLLAVASREVENVEESAAERLRGALTAYRAAAGAWLMRVTVRRAVDKRYDPLTAADPTLHDAGRKLVAALRGAVS